MKKGRWKTRTSKHSNSLHRHRAWIIQSYLPGGAHVPHPVHSSIGSHEFTLNGTLIGSAIFAYSWS